MSPGPHPRTALDGTMRLLAAWMVMLWLAGSTWPSTVDDVYITLAYARQWVETGQLTWVDGTRVEGYSNFLLVALFAAGLATGLDGGLLAQWTSMLSGLSILAFLHRSLPRTPGGTIILLGIASSAAFTHWTSIGMDTMLFTLLLLVGWHGVTQRGVSTGVGVTFLGLASLCRLEGAVHLILGLILRYGRTRRLNSTDVVPATALAVLALYHLIRTSWFGAFLPTPLLVKISGQPVVHHGLLQAMADVTLSFGVLLAAWLVRERDRRASLVALGALGIQVAVIARAGGDWMGHGRLVLPGVVVTASLLASSGSGGGSLTSLPRAIAILAAIVGALYQSTGYGTYSFTRRSLADMALGPLAYARGLDTPLAEDLVWVADRLPPGSEFLAVDAGVLSTVPHARLIDMRGLVERSFAEAIASGTVQEKLRVELAADSTDRYLRIAAWSAQAFPAVPEWMLRGRESHTELRYGDGIIRWYPSLPPLAPDQTRRERWERLLAIYGSQPFVVWHAALAFADLGELDRAQTLIAEAAKRWPRDQRFTGPAQCLLFTRSDQELRCDGERGTLVGVDASVWTRPLGDATDDPHSLHVHVDGDGHTRIELELIGANCPPGQQLEVSTTDRLDIATDPCGDPAVVRLRNIGDSPLWLKGVDSP